MNTSVINFKTDSRIKREAQRAAKNLGFSLSSILNAYLRKFVRTRRVEFADDVRLELTPWAKRMLRQAERDEKAGKASPRFTSVEESFEWLDDPRARYQNGDLVRR